MHRGQEWGLCFIRAVGRLPSSAAPWHQDTRVWPLMKGSSSV
uniref:Uncharacterized protein n=1 Tax=Arundo donax TaxID=35708 RepID=A0A0A9B4L3_ARUDO